MSAGAQGPERGFSFPGEFELTAMGPTAAGLERRVPAWLLDAGVETVGGVLRVRASSGGRFVAVTVCVRAASRADLEAAHAALRAHPEVKWTL
ncbi:MAG: UPF0250 protein [Lysobacteraceae bacterium]|nr:MAG: UPF0250 protein [Xanthomonadaceae bacterium]